MIYHFSMMKKASLWAAFVVLAAAAAGAQMAPLQERMVDIGGTKLHMAAGGSGTVTVVFESGLGETAQAWVRIAPQVAQFARVVAYDRASLGQSEESSAPRTFARMAEDLHRLLAAAGIPGPYVLVGHSLGGGIVRTYAATYTNEVAGLVLVDPFTTAIWKKDPERVARERAAMQAAMRSAPVGVRREFEATDAASERGFPELPAPRVAPGTAVALLIARQGRPPQWEQSVLEEYLPLVIGSPDGALMLLPSSGHHIQFDQPETVLNAIRRAVFPDAINVIARTIATAGIDAGVQKARAIKQGYPPEFFPEPALNTAGYLQLYHEGWRPSGINNPRNAIALFGLNAEFYPQSANVYDSLAEAYEVAGDRAAALTNYRKSLALDPHNSNAARRIKALELPPR